MTSAIDPTKPTTGIAYTQDVRNNFNTAANEITALQAALATAQADIQALKDRTVAAITILTPNPPNTNSTNSVMAGINVQFTPQSSTRAVVLLEGHLGNVQNGQTSYAQLIYGTGTSPAAGTLVSATNGQLIGLPVSGQAPRANGYQPFTAVALIETLTPATLYWIGVSLSTGTGGTALLSQMTLTAFEILDPLP
jgi:hypothetical protein